MSAIEPQLHGRPESTDGFDLTTRRHGHCYIVDVDGGLDGNNAKHVHATIEELCAAPPAEVTTVVLDLSRVRVLDAAGLDAILTAQQRAKGLLDMRIVAAAQPVLAPLQANDAANQLAIYASVGAAVDPDREELGRLRNELDQRHDQLASQPVIEQAKGMLMQNFQLSPDDAFAVLKRLSQESNTKVHVIAARLIANLSGAVTEQTAQTSLKIIDDLRQRLTEERT